MKTVYAKLDIADECFPKQRVEFAPQRTLLAPLSQKLPVSVVLVKTFSLTLFCKNTSE